MGYSYSIVNTCASKWTLNDKLKLKLVHPEKKQRVYDAQTRKNANSGTGISTRGVLRFELDRGVPLEPQKPYPSLRVILAKKGTHF